MANQKNISFQELVDEATRDIFNSLIEHGGSNMKIAIHKWMFQAIEWDKKNSKQ